MEDGPSLQFGSLVGMYRREANLTQRELAAKAGLSVAALRDHEQGRRCRLRPHTLAALAFALGLNADQAAGLARAAAIPRRRPDLSAQPRHARDGFGAGPLRDPTGKDQVLWLAALGPLGAWQNGTPLSLGPPAQRAVFGLLLLDPGALVRRDTIIDVLWGDAPPRTAAGLVQAHVSRIRRLLGKRGRFAGTDRVLDSVNGAYRLILSRDELDLLVFRDLAARAAAAHASGDVMAAAELYDQAVGLWRGDPFADVDALRAHPGVTALKQELAGVLLMYAEVACTLGQPYRVLPRLQRLADAEPLNELAHARLIIALAGAGQQAAAIRVYQDVRVRLDQELGLYPGEELSEAYLRVLRQDIRAGIGGRERARPPALAAAGHVVPRQLPAAPRGFTGRARELAALSRLLERESREASGVVIAALTGMAGIGKTALAVHWAHRVADQFPDGQLFVNLRGSSLSGVPVTPTEAVRTFLTALGAPPARIPAGTDGQAALYRTLLVDRRMLIVLDNAQDAEQVRPLLPGSPGCMAVVTSRNRLTGLAAAEGAHLITLDALTDSESRDLLSTNLGTERAKAEPAAVSELIALCGRLPLALCDVAARAVARPGLPLRALVAEMQDARGRLDVLDTGESATSVRVVFSWSRAKLGHQASRMFRLLGIHPGPDITVSTAASLAAVPRGQAYLALTRLCDEHLLTEYAPGRYGFHDLLRAYAAERARSSDSDAERRAAVRRVLDYYLHTARAAAALLCPYRTEARWSRPQPGVVPEEIGGPAQAAEWFENERHALLAVIGRAAEEGQAPHAWELPWVAGWYFHDQVYRQRLVVAQESALPVAVRQGDLAGQAMARQHLGWLRFLLGDIVSADDYLAEADELARHLDDGRLRALTGLSRAYLLESQNHPREAMIQVRHALRLCRTGDRGGEADARYALGWHVVQLRDRQHALNFTSQVLMLYREPLCAADC
jgi:DNA-binding SARP family transcriptional activator/transcriptional regulator with XRE-family HTH domain/tetratricopeptide (TPR) repeat protein